MDEFEKEVKSDFLFEATQLLNDSEQAFLALESNKDDPELMNQIFRLAHNLKGTSRAVGFGDVAEFTHEWENLILKLKEGSIQITDSIVSLLLECNDHVSVMIKMLNMDMMARFESHEIIAKIHQALSGNYITPEVSAPEVALHTNVDTEEVIIAKVADEDVNIDGQKLIDEFNEKINLDALEDLKLLDQNSNIKSHLPTEVNTSNQKETMHSQNAEPSPNKTPEKNHEKTSKGPAVEDESIRVSLQRVENLNNVVGELVIIQTVLNQHREEIKNPLMLKSLSQLAKLSKEIQNISMSLRMIPLKQTFQKMQRIVRDTSKALNKKVHLELIGEDTEIDKTVLEHLSDPLVHIVRNAVDHGLETTDGREKAGKNLEGHVTLKAYHEGNNLVIEIKDDGKGINPKIIREKAIEKKVISEKQNLTDDEIVNLIFHPGFSTKSEVSEISGRGVGMDVVKTNIEKLSGEVKIQTQVGKGSTFKVVLPLTLAIIDGMVTKIGDERYIIPLAQIFESLSPTKETVHYVNGVGECLKIRGEVLPLMKISKTLGRPFGDKPIYEQIAIIVNSEERNFAVLVDDISHQQQVVIKKLGDEIKNQKGFMGSSILGDGRPAFILDLIELYSGTMKKRKFSMDDHSFEEQTFRPEQTKMSA